MIVRNKIWEEFKQAKANVECIARYTSMQRQLSIIYQVIIAIVAALGPVISRYTEVSVYILTLGVIVCLSLMKAFFSKFLQSENELLKLDSLMTYYNSFQNKLEILFYKLDKNQMTEDEVITELFKLKEDDCEMHTQMNKLLKVIPGFIQKKVNKKTEEYIKRVYYGIYEQNNDKKQSAESAGNTSDSNDTTTT